MAKFSRPQVLILLAVIGVFSAAAITAPVLGQEQKVAAKPLAWAYAVLENPPPPPPPPTDNDKTATVPGSTQTFTMRQIRDLANPVDWFPGDHPPVPRVVSHRSSPGVNPWVGGCGWCHLVNGFGRPENAPLAGLPAGYILEELSDFTHGARKTANPGKRNTATMSGNAAGITEAESVAAANYFSAIKLTPWIKVVETDTVPKSRNANGFYVPLEGNEMEPIGMRIMEMPVDPEMTELFRNPHSGWIAYVPKGSVKKGEELVERGGAGKTIACAACHGEGLKGNGNFPPLAGRSPSYFARQLYDIQQYTRNGPGTQLMRPVVQNLTEEDILDITAYLASLKP
jgi:cytochrome c553